MSKQKHIHVLHATIHVALEYNPADLTSITTLNAQMREAARKLPGYRDIDIRLGKVPAPAVVVETVPTQPVSDLDIPAALKR